MKNITFTNNNLEKIGKYVLVEKVNKSTQKKYFCGKYEFKGREYFIKTWEGKKKDYLSRCIIYEYNSSKLVYKKLIKLNKSNKRLAIKIPKPIEKIVTSNTISTVYEYIEGKNISDSKKMANAVYKSILALRELTVYFQDEEIKYLKARKKQYYLLTLIPYYLFFIIKHPNFIRKTILETFRSLYFLLFETNDNYVLSHRDLNSENFLVNKNGLYLLDLEHFCISIPDYDYAYAVLESKNKKVATLLSQYFHEMPRKELLFFIILEQIRDASTQLTKHYINSLYAILWKI